MRLRVLETGLGRVFGLVLGASVFAGLIVPLTLHQSAVADEPGRETPGTIAAPGLTPAEARLKADVSFLAADAREGRAPEPTGSRTPPGILPRLTSSTASSRHPALTATSRSFP